MASASLARRKILTGAGLDIIVDPADMDEGAFKRQNTTLNMSTMALGLATEKAKAVSKRHPDTVVIGADQTMVCGGTPYDKPPNLAAARYQLQALRGRAHTLHSAVSVIRDGDLLWSVVDDAHMTMRPFDDAFLDAYLAQSGDAVLSSVGCYRLEERGAHLFSHIDGDFFTILGLPLLPLLQFLRTEGVLH